MMSEGGALNLSAETREKWIKAFEVDPRGSSSIKPYTEKEKGAYEEKLRLLRARIARIEKVKDVIEMYDEDGALIGAGS